MKSDGQALGRMGYTQIPESVKTVSWNWASRSVELRRVVLEQLYERLEARLPPNLSYRSTEMVDSEDQDEDKYVLR